MNTPPLARFPFARCGLAWIPIPLLVTAMIALWVADVRVVWPLRPLNWLVHYGSAVLALAFIVAPAARSFLANGQPSVLMLGSGVFMTEIGVLAMPMAFAQSSDAAFAIYNTSAWLSALCHFAGVAITSQRKIRLRRPAGWLSAAFAGGLAAMGLVIWGALTGRMPDFFIDGQGGTLLRSLVVGSAVALFALTAALLWQTHRRTASPFLYWYALGLVLLAAGLTGSMVIAVKDSPLQWVTRFTQVFGVVYMCVAVLNSERASRASAPGIPLAAVEEAWRQGKLLPGIRNRPRVGWVLRYGLAVGAVAAAFGFWLAIKTWSGAALPPFITFYPAVMVVALMAGLGPGLLVTGLTALIVAYWIMPPVGQFSIAASVDRFALVMFGAMGVLMSGVAELYRRNRDKAAAYDREVMWRESREALRREVELIDSVRAEIIAREMQRVMRERGGAGTSPAQPREDTLRRVPLVAGAAVAGVGLLVLIGWGFGLDALRSVVPGMARMKVNTALCLVLAGVALARSQRRALRLACAGMVAVVSALSLTEYVAGADFGIDQLWVRDPGDALTVPGRMAQVTGIGFILTSLSLLLVAARARAAGWIQQAAAVAVGTLGLTALLGYAYDVRQLYGLAGFSTMAMHTATALVLLAVGLVCARADGIVAQFVAVRPGGSLARWLLPGALLLPAIGGWLRVRGSKAGLFEPNFGTGLFAIGMMVAFAALVWWTARLLNRADAVQRETELQLRNQAELMDHAHEALIVREPGGVIRSWNRGAEVFYGWPAAEALGQQTHALLRTQGVDVAAMDAQLERIGRWEGELIHTTHDGHRITVESRQTASRIGDGQVFILQSDRDITERRRAEEELEKHRLHLEQLVQERTAELRKSERRYRTLFERMDEGFCVVDMLYSPDGQPVDYRFLEINPAFEKQTGLTQALGKTIRELVPGHDAHWFETYGQVARTGEAVRCEHRATAMNRWFDVYAFRLDGPGSTRVAIIFNNITERKRAETAIQEANERLEQRVAERTAELRANNEELARFNRAMVDRELRMIELKKQINAFCTQTGQPRRYPLEFVKETAP